LRTAITLTGVFVVVVGAIVEVIGVLFANRVLGHNTYGFAGGILAVLGIMAISQGMRKPPSPGHPIQKKSGFEP
jgi:uncharacterized membrane protein required for colicin V production